VQPRHSLSLFYKIKEKRKRKKEAKQALIISFETHPLSSFFSPALLLLPSSFFFFLLVLAEKEETEREREREREREKEKKRPIVTRGFLQGKFSSSLALGFDVCFCYWVCLKPKIECVM
jgi:hypothetical protein